jgi:hypothetical protein
MKYAKTSNIKFARGIAAAFTSARLYSVRKPDGWVGEDSELRLPYWKVGGNAVIVEEGKCLRSLRWHRFLRETRQLKYPA